MLCMAAHITVPWCVLNTSWELIKNVKDVLVGTQLSQLFCRSRFQLHSHLFFESMIALEATQWTVDEVEN